MQAHKKISYIFFFLLLSHAPMRHAAESEHHDVATYLELGNNLRQNNKPEEALALYKTAQQIYPDSSKLLYQTGHILKELNRLDEAIACYQKVLAHNPEHSQAHLGLAQCYLTRGDFHLGWPDFEWRGPAIRAFSSYAWKNADLSDTTILLRAEWGFGDHIQFIRYAKLLKERGATVIMQTYAALKKLFSLCPYIDTVIATGEAFPKHDIQLPLLSLPKTFGTTIETIPVSIPYLHADTTLQRNWEQYFSDNRNIKIGICWHGSGNQNAPHALNKNMPLKTILSLAELENVSLYCLQKQTGVDELDDQTKSVLHIFDGTFDQTHGRFMDTAAVMQHLDLVVTVDTSIAHLAGALGVPTWVMLSYKADWRWMINRDDSPWYPTMRLFRQKTPGDWDTIIYEVKTALRTILATKP